MSGQGSPRQKRVRRRDDGSTIDNRKSLQVTFSKRKAGLFKKASELSILCDAQICIMGYSPGNKPFAFGLPNAGEVISRYSSSIGVRPPGTQEENALATYQEHLNKINLQQLVNDLNEMKDRFGDAREKKQEFVNRMKGYKEEGCDIVVDEMDPQQCEYYKNTFGHLLSEINAAKSRQMSSGAGWSVEQVPFQGMDPNLPFYVGYVSPAPAAPFNYYPYNSALQGNINMNTMRTAYMGSSSRGDGIENEQMPLHGINSRYSNISPSISSLGYPTAAPDRNYLSFVPQPPRPNQVGFANQSYNGPRPPHPGSN